MASAVFGVPSEYTEEDVKVVIVARHSLSAERVIEWATGRLPRYALPRFVEFTDHLPITETGKVRKSDLKNNWRNQQTFDLESRAYIADVPAVPRRGESIKSDR